MEDAWWAGQWLKQACVLQIHIQDGAPEVGERKREFLADLRAVNMTSSQVLQVLLISVCKNLESSIKKTTDKPNSRSNKAMDDLNQCPDCTTVHVPSW